MKVKLYSDQAGPNYYFDSGRPAGHDNPREVIHPRGTIIDHPSAHRLCCWGYMNAPPVAEPFDSEAKAKYAEHQAQRKNAIAILMGSKPPKKKAAKKHFDDLQRAYANADLEAPAVADDDKTKV